MACILTSGTCENQMVALTCLVCLVSLVSRDED
jgi:hypothetical protein